MEVVIHGHYSNLTGFNTRIVNPEQKPLQGYWTVIKDSQAPGTVWNSVNWEDNLPLDGCGIEVWLRASDDRLALANAASPFVAAARNQVLTGIQGRYLEIRVSLQRNASTQIPRLNSLTINGTSAALSIAAPIQDVVVMEGQEAVFQVVAFGAEPLSYVWQVKFPWDPDFRAVTEADYMISGQGSAELRFTSPQLEWNGDRDWSDGSGRRPHTQCRVFITDAAGRTVSGGQGDLFVVPSGGVIIPPRGKAAVYPLVKNIFGKPANPQGITIKLKDLYHDAPGDLDILVVSPGGKKIMLMSDAGGNTPIEDLDLTFEVVAADEPGFDGGISSGSYVASNHAEQEDTLPGAPSGPYSSRLEELLGDNPNGVWQLYIHDDSSGYGGRLGSWEVNIQ